MSSAAKKPFFQYFRRTNPASTEPVEYEFPPLNPFIEPDPPHQPEQNHHGLHLVEHSTAPAPPPLPHHRRAILWVAYTYRNTVCALCGRPRARTRKRRARFKHHLTAHMLRRSKQA